MLARLFGLAIAFCLGYAGMTWLRWIFSESNIPVLIGALCILLCLPYIIEGDRR